MKNAKENALWQEIVFLHQQGHSQRAMNNWHISAWCSVCPWKYFEETEQVEDKWRRIFSRWKVSQCDVLKKKKNHPAKTWHRTWQMHLDLQLIHLLFADASSEMVSTKGWLSRSHFTSFLFSGVYMKICGVARYFCSNTAIVLGTCCTLQRLSSQLYGCKRGMCVWEVRAADPVSPHRGRITQCNSCNTNFEDVCPPTHFFLPLSHTFNGGSVGNSVRCPARLMF